MIKDNLVKKCLEMFADTAEKKDAFLKFFEQFVRRSTLFDELAFTYVTRNLSNPPRQGSAAASR